MLEHCGHRSSTRRCSCGTAASFSIFFPMAGCGKFAADVRVFDLNESSGAASSVDCTLSLGTPSTRASPAARPPSCVSSSSSGFRWDFISQRKKQASSGAAASSGGSRNTIGSDLGGDPLLLARRCANCGTTSTPLWRNGPCGPKSLCNACGIRYKKEERRAAASAVSPTSSTASGATTVGDQAIGYGHYQQPPRAPTQHQQHPPWAAGCYASSTPSKGSSASLYDAANDDDVPYLSWRLNLVPPTQFPIRDRPTLFQYNV